jgi:serine/threonine protein kinase
MQIIDNLILEQPLGKGSFGQVYLSRFKDDNTIYATKVYNREKLEGTEAMKYLTDEIVIMNELQHPNIVKFADVKKTKKHFYIVMEFCNGGELEKALEKYQLKYGKPFSEEIVQHLMRQIIDAIKYIHNLNIIHRDIKTENIMVNFENEVDQINLNMMNAKAKLIDFGISCYTKKGLAYTVLGNPKGMAPMILNAYHNNKHYTQGYDEKADIWSLGSLCYELLLGHTAFNAESFDELVNKVENGTYNIPTNLSKEVVSFLNGMLQYDPKKRYSANQLANHPFLIKRVQDFHRMDLRKVSKKVVNANLEINVKKNQTIWAIFNKEDEQKLLSIGDLNNNLNPTNTSLKPINESMTLSNSNFQNYIPPGGRNLYGISMFPKNNKSSQQISMSAKASDFSNKMNNQPAINYPTFSLPTIDMSKYLNINKANTIPPPNNIPNNSQLSQDINHSNYIPANNLIVDENEKGSGCYIY